jgi:hypothetical protein
VGGSQARRTRKVEQLSTDTQQENNEYIALTKMTKMHGGREGKRKGKEASIKWGKRRMLRQYGKSFSLASLWKQADQH